LYGKTLFIGAHTDDIELFAGGLLSKLARSQHDAVHCLTFSSHRGVTDSVMAAAEHTENMKALKVHFTLRDMKAVSGEFQEQRQAIYNTIANMIETAKIDLVVTHPEDTNQDHQQVRMEVLRACKGLCSIISGEFPFNEVHGRKPDLFVGMDARDISMKCTMIQNYQSQYAPHRKYFQMEVWEGLARVRGAQIGRDFAEGFYVDRMILD
jgi:LmbE family N-acetylglucosaminyl deacetylase